MRLDQLLLQPVHRVLELVHARLELVGVSRARGQPRARDLDDGTSHDPRERDNPDDDKSEVRIHGSILRSPGTGGYCRRGWARRNKARQPTTPPRLAASPQVLALRRLWRLTTAGRRLRRFLPLRPERTQDIAGAGPLAHEIRIVPEPVPHQPVEHTDL